jgi:zinc transporter ZupT
MQDTWQISIFSVIFIGCAPILLLWFVPVASFKVLKTRQAFLNILLAFACGGLLGDVFLHLLPHSFQPHSFSIMSPSPEASSLENRLNNIPVGFSLIAGLLSFFLLEKLLRNFQGKFGTSSSQTKYAKGKSLKERKFSLPPVKVVGYLNLLADFVHNFTDGLTISASYLFSAKLGFLTTLAVFVHEVKRPFFTLK